MRPQVSPVLIVVLALAAAGCAKRPQTYTMIDPATGQQTQVMFAQPPQTFAQAPAAPVYAQAPSPQAAAVPVYAQARPPQAAYAQAPGAAAQNYALTQGYVQQPQPAAADDDDRGPDRGLFGSRRSAAPAQPQAQQPYVIQYGAGQPAYVPPQQQLRAAVPAQVGGPYQAYASAAPYEPAYTLDAGDRLRIVVFGQDGISNSYLVDASGNVNMPLIGSVAARGTTPQQLSSLITTRLKQGYVREPHVTVEVEAYRPFFILGEVTNPGQYPYVANMTAETAIAIAGGFAPRAAKGKVQLTRNAGGQQFHGDIPLNYQLKPGDTIVVKERWF